LDRRPKSIDPINLTTISKQTLKICIVLIVLFFSLFPCNSLVCLNYDGLSGRRGGVPGTFAETAAEAAVKAQVEDGRWKTRQADVDDQQPFVIFWTLQVLAYL
jgi:hypothetical protein